MAKGGLNDDEDDLISLGRKTRPRALSEQQNNGTPNIVEVVEAPRGLESGQSAPTIEARIDPPPAVPIAAAVVVPVAAAVADDRRPVGRPRKPEPRMLLRATLKKINYEWVDEQWRSRKRADGGRYANCGEFVDELVEAVRTRAGG